VLPTDDAIEEKADIDTKIIGIEAQVNAENGFLIGVTRLQSGLMRIFGHAGG
jgi:hypothetical protein